MTSPHVDVPVRRPLSLEIELLRAAEGLNEGQYQARLLVDGQDVGYRTGWDVSDTEAERHLVARLSETIGALMHSAS